MSLAGCFELFGFDLIMDADWRVWLLEANAEPDFGQAPLPVRHKLAQRQLNRLSPTVIFIKFQACQACKLSGAMLYHMYDQLGSRRFHDRNTSTIASWHGWCAAVWMKAPSLRHSTAQTGVRLKGLVAGVVEATLQLAADPVAAAHHKESAAIGDSAGRSTAAADTASADGGRAASAGSQHSGGGGDGGGGVAEALAAAHFVEVFSSRVGGASQGPSGIRMH